ncbi:aldo-keto reductase family 1 member A1-like [Teleopsis dalmanni]|uniref:aldo-keto reductase family 1 member A1-like n=1 Tax=Teleopsis dalmanni TaxID=139649 RepID=UPI0018CCBCC1|nr:aldo-keto reductase family 1 member A1-like [Teleopsis dalmanni]
MESEQYLTFNNGQKMPVLGLGTWQATEEEIERAIDLALDEGYRHIDTAPVYLNEKAIGRVLKKWLDSGKVRREELFIVTKLPPIANRPEEVEETIKQSLADLQLDYVDLYLIHTPFTLYFGDGDIKRDENGDVVIDSSTNHVAVWKKMEEMIDNGYTKSIGLSNFNKQQIQKLLPSCRIRPVNLQIEHHIYLQQRDLINYCKEENIVVTAYAPLGSKGIAALNKKAGVEREIPDLMNVPEVLAIAKAHSRTTAQILLRWVLDNGLAAIPKSTNPVRLRQNLNIFDFKLTAEEIQTLSKLDENIRVCDFSFFKGITNHPEFPF